VERGGVQFVQATLLSGVRSPRSSGGGTQSKLAKPALFFDARRPGQVVRNLERGLLSNAVGTRSAEAKENNMTRKFHNKKSAFWLIGMGVLITGFLAFSLIVPNLSPTPASEPELRVPNMQNVPPANAPHMGLETK